MNNQSKKTEKLKPQDSVQKNIRDHKNDDKAVLKKEDEVYTKEEADFKNIAKKRENSEQPVNSGNKKKETK
ncbi:MAG: hypothetical protein WBP45_15265 [Daejeonella sp.]